MKSLRKSLNGYKDQSHHISSPVSPLPPLSKPIAATQPPKKVIRALQSHRASAPQELSFEKGDFFHVVNDVGSGFWYEAHNPMTGARGLVPRNMFEVFGKGGAMSPVTSHVQAHSPRPVTSPASPKVQVYYAVVLHDFVAERADELDAKAGDAISVVAQSNREWFVAKPIGRLGKPGLIPVSFVEIRDPATGSPVPDVNSLIDSGALPRVEEWKKSVMNYKANSISLGVLDDSSLAQSSPFSMHNKSSGPNVPINIQGPSPNTYQSHSDVAGSAVPPKTMPAGILLSADVKSFHFEMDEYWFRVHAIFQPYSANPSDSLPHAKQLVLFRSYNDFYEFQVALLDTFPTEAGRANQPRILPYMPGPVDHADDEITITRRQELDEYLHHLCKLQSNARYILEDILIRQFLASKPGDVEADIEPRSVEMDNLWRMSRSNNVGSNPESNRVSELNSRLSHLNVSERQRGSYSDASDYEDDVDVLRPFEGHLYTSVENAPPKSRPSHQRTESASSFHRPLKLPTHSRSSSRTNSPLPLSGKYDNEALGQSRMSLASSHDPSPTSVRSSQATSASGRSRAHSNAAVNTPPISASNPQTAFVKIKIYDQETEELVAIRVHPRVTHSQLLDKAGARLGKNVQQLRYRDSLNNELVGLGDDAELRSWLDRTERLVLYAEPA